MDAAVDRRVAFGRSRRGAEVTHDGRGTFARQFRPIRRSSPGRLAREQWGRGEAIQQADTADRPRAVDVVTGETEAVEWVAGPLGLSPGSPVVYRSRRFLVDGRAVQLATSYLPVDLARGTAIMRPDAGPGGIYARLAESGHGPAAFTEYLRARMPLPDETDRLALPEGALVVEVTRHAFDDSARCVEVNRMILDGSAYLLDYTFTA
ncbi:UTRA domain-containing protein [Micromonospora fluostatini]|uniref:UTRA domain-containing protein n=1 Tax=Micromonospora sp. JCM 30529 TaxID=3421643 RepID=UPI003D1779B1